jgi:hypothetical protein
VWEPEGMKGGGHGRLGRPGAVALVLLFGTSAVALALTLVYHLGVPGLVSTFVLGLTPLYLGWVALQGDARPQSLGQIGDELAARLRSQWADEAEARGLNDPYPLPMAWTAADPPLAGDLDTLRTLATSGFGWSASPRESWAGGPEDLAGGGRKLPDILAAVPAGRLVVLGEPGTGKTMLMVGLVLDLLHPDRRGSGGPVPVLAPLASWDPESKGLHDWLGATLITGYPDLAATPPPGSSGDNRFEALLAAGLILPVMDGLDEIPDAARPRAIDRINKELKPGEPVVVTCRTEQYQAAVSPPGGQGTALRAAVVQLSPLPFAEVARYLRKDAGHAGEDRWDFLDGLDAESPVRQALTTPLMAGLARAIYNPRPDERASDLRHPSELCDFADRAAVEAQLFDAFIPARYRLPAGSRWTAGQAETWLVFLARHLELIGGPDLAWWQLRKTMPRSVFRVVSGVVGGVVGVLVFGLLGGVVGGVAGVLVLGLLGGLGAGPRLGLVGGLVFDSAKAPARSMRISVKSLRAGLRAGLLGGLVLGLGLGLGGGVVWGLAGGIIGVLVLGVVSGFLGEPGTLARVTNPAAVLARDRRVALLLISMTGLMFGLVGGVAAGLGFGLVFGLVGGVAAGLLGGLLIGFYVSGTQTAWPSYMLTRAWLAWRHQLPWPLMSFLADAHRRGVLRQAGAVYQFRHINLQRRLATRR